MRRIEIDPATLTIRYLLPHYAPFFSSTSAQRAGEELKLAAFETLGGSHSVAARRIRELPEPFSNIGFDLVSSIWHEQRHYVDLLLTNFGSLLRRSSLVVGLELFEALIEGGHSRTTMVPLSVYEDPVKRHVYGLDNDPEFLSQMGKRAGNVERFSRFDADVPGGYPGSFGLGGRSQMEALAFAHQARVAHEEFGFEAAARLLRSGGQAEHSVSLNYRWATTLFARANLARALHKDAELELHAGEPVSAILYAALAQRAHGQEGGGASCFQRLAMLVDALRCKPAFADIERFEDVWCEVNRTCRQLWGRTAIEEMWIDHERTTQLLEDCRTRYGSAGLPIIDFFESAERVRNSLLKALMADPAQVVNPPSFRALLDRLKVPAVVLCDRGAVGIPDGWIPIHVGSEREAPITSEGHYSWWWSALVPQVNNLHDREFEIDQGSWSAVFRLWGPMAKLAVAGRRGGALIGPEFLYCEEKLRQEGFKFKIAPGYTIPRSRVDVADFWRSYLEDWAYCDGCPDRLPRGAGFAVSAWEMRESGEKYLWAVERYNRTRDGEAEMKKDWTWWMLCAKCYADLESKAGE